MSRAARTALDRRHRDRQNELADRVTRALATLLGSLADLEQPELERYASSAFPIVAGGQQASAELGAGYVTALVRRKPRARPANVPAALERSGVLVTPAARTLVAPVLRARRLVAEGSALPAAIDTASSYASSLATLDLQAAQRVGLAEGTAAADVEPSAWVKEPVAGACSWCLAIAGTEFSDPDAVPFHDNDRCAVVPAIDGADLAELYTDTPIPF